MPRETLRRICLLVPAAFFIAACRTAQPAGGFQPDRGFGATSRSSDVLACHEIQSAPVDNAHEAVMRFRPEFLKRRSNPGPSNPGSTGPTVFVDGVREGGADILLTIPVSAIVEIRYLNANAASDRFGAYYSAGVIAVRTRR